MEQENVPTKDTKPAKKGKKWLLIVLIVLIVLLAGIITYLLVKKSQTKGTATSTASATVTVTASAKKTTTKTPAKTTTKTATSEESVAQTDTSQGPDEEAINSSKTVAQNFIEARKSRDLDEAKPYVTDAFLAKYSQESFAGTSSPGVGSFDIGNVTVVESGAKYDVSVTVHWILGGEESGTTVWTLHIVKQDNEFLVDDYVAPM